MLPSAASVIQDTLILQQSRFHQNPPKLKEGAWQSLACNIPVQPVTVLRQVSPEMVTRGDTPVALLTYLELTGEVKEVHESYNQKGASDTWELSHSWDFCSVSQSPLTPGKMSSQKLQEMESRRISSEQVVVLHLVLHRSKKMDLHCLIPSASTTLLTPLLE